MRVFFIPVSRDARGRNAALLQLVVQQHARAAPPLTVDEAYPLAGKIFKCVNSARVAGQEDKTLLPFNKPNQQSGFTRKLFPNSSPVVDAGRLIQQVTARHMTLAPPQSDQPPQRTHMCGSQAETRVRTAQKAVNEVKCIVMAANGQQRPFNLFTRAQ